MSEPEKFMWLECQDSIRSEILELVRSRIGKGCNAIGFYDTKEEMTSSLMEDLPIKEGYDV